MRNARTKAKAIAITRAAKAEAEKRTAFLLASSLLISLLLLGAGRLIGP